MNLLPELKKIMVAGASSNCGKTAMCELLLASLPGYGALKVTRVADEGAVCPRGGRGCGVCGSLKKSYDLITEPGSLFVEGTDTDRFRRAGAERVAWIIGLTDSLSDAWQEAKGVYEGLQGVVVESNSILHPQECTLSLLILNPAGKLRWKPSVWRLLPLVDRVIVNLRHPVSDRTLEETLQEAISIRGYDDLIIVEDLQDALRAIANRLHNFSKLL